MDYLVLSCFRSHWNDSPISADTLYKCTWPLKRPAAASGSSNHFLRLWRVSSNFRTTPTLKGQNCGERRQRNKLGENNVSLGSWLEEGCCPPPSTMLTEIPNFAPFCSSSNWERGWTWLRSNDCLDDRLIRKCSKKLAKFGLLPKLPCPPRPHLACFRKSKLSTTFLGHFGLFLGRGLDLWHDAPGQPGAASDPGHLNLEEKCFTSLLLLTSGALIGIKSDLNAPAEMQGNCWEGGCYFGWEQIWENMIFYIHHIFMTIWSRVVVNFTLDKGQMIKWNEVGCYFGRGQHSGLISSLNPVHWLYWTTVRDIWENNNKKKLGGESLGK